MTSPNWVKTSLPGDCACCGWKATGPHYVSRITGSHHCVSCHRIDHNWHRAGDSEGAGPEKREW